MDLKMVNQIEERCRRMSFEEATVDCVHLRPMLQAWPSKVIQSRIEFDDENTGTILLFYWFPDLRISGFDL